MKILKLIIIAVLITHITIYPVKEYNQYSRFCDETDSQKSFWGRMMGNFVDRLNKFSSKQTGLRLTKKRSLDKQKMKAIQQKIKNTPADQMKILIERGGITAEQKPYLEAIKAIHRVEMIALDNKELAQETVSDERVQSWMNSWLSK